MSVLARENGRLFGVIAKIAAPKAAASITTIQSKT